MKKLGSQAPITHRHRKDPESDLQIFTFEALRTIRKLYGTKEGLHAKF